MLRHAIFRSTSRSRDVSCEIFHAIGSPGNIIAHSSGLAKCDGSSTRRSSVQTCIAMFVELTVRSGFVSISLCAVSPCARLFVFCVYCMTSLLICTIESSVCSRRCHIYAFSPVRVTHNALISELVECSSRFDTLLHSFHPRESRRCHIHALFSHCHCAVAAECAISTFIVAQTPLAIVSRVDIRR